LGRPFEFLKVAKVAHANVDEGRGCARLVNFGNVCGRCRTASRRSLCHARASRSFEPKQVYAFRIKFQLLAQGSAKAFARPAKEKNHMKRDMDLVRKILLAIEASPSGRAPEALQIEGYDAAQIGYHVVIMMEAGLVEGIDTSDMDSPGPEASPTRLTWSGHEFLDAARPPERWERVKAMVAKVGGATMPVWLDLLRKAVSDAVGL
jgi:hypothetical protein